MAAVAAEAAATAASPGEGGAGEAEPEMEPIPGSEAGTDPLPVTATEASVPDGGEADGQADEHRLPLAPPPPPSSSPGELARSPEAEKPPEPSLPASPAPQPEPRDEPPLSPPQPAAPPPPASPQLIPGSEVRVTLDHIIEDALVVSFRLGDKLFSGVLMDLSKRFGPHGIPVTVFPKREYKEKPEAMPLQSTTFQEVNGAVPDTPPPAVPCPELSLPESLWPRKPPPLFHDGAPYPPPLFIRDTYNQAIPQPPPRRIKRPKRKMYREEPTSIMNAIKLRPRQVLCDKCKNSVVAEKKEIRKGSATDSAKYEDKKRRHESVATVNKKLRTEPKADARGAAETHKRGAGAGAGAVVRVAGLPGRGRVVRVPAQAAKKVLQSKNLEQAKARDVLKLAKDKAPRRQGEPAAAAPRAAHPKAHLTRRYQTPGSGALPPRVRLKPQRYRNEENDSSLKSRPAARSAGESPSAGPGAQEDPACLPAQSDAAPGSFAFPPAAPTPREEKRQRRAGALNLKIFSKNVSKCVTPDGRTICVGDIVWAKIYGFPWWPGRILTITVSRRDNGLLARQEARISWFGSPTTSFLALSQLAPFLENFQARFNKKRKGLYRKAITEAARAAKQLTPEVRALLTQFET